jgi:hypothetical protein
MLSEEERRTIAEESGKQLMAEIDKADKEGRIFSLTDEQLLKFSKQCWPKTDPESIIQWRRQHLAEPKR